MQAFGPRGQVTFRVIEDSDRDLLLALYAGTREWEFQQTLWAEAEKQDFLKRQFEAQCLSYQMSFPGAVHRIIVLDGTDIGRLIVDRQDDCLRIIDLTIASEWQGRGIGTDILRSLINEAHGGKVPVRLSVERNSPAIALYLRHGFKATGETPSHFAMEWRPDTGPRVI